MDDDEESKYDSSSFYLDSKRWRQKGYKYSYGRRPIGNLGSSKALLGGGSSALKKLPLSSLTSSEGHSDSKTPIKKKNTMNIKKTSGNNGFPSDIDLAKQRKNSVLIGGTKDESIKRYHQMVATQNGSSNNGSLSRANTLSSNTKNGTTKPRRNTVAINGLKDKMNNL